MNHPATPQPATSRAAQLRRLLESNELEFLLEAHNGMSARIAELAGFRGIWASGFALSAQFGVRDSNEASWTQVVEMLEFMTDVTSVPVLLDGDTGYGNFNNMRRLVRKLEQRSVAGVCIEDKLFPKTNSFLAGERQSLADVDEFCGKIKAGKDSQHDPDFCVVARIEALIAGWGITEALRRAEAYRLAGADAILIHSKISRADEILAFAGEWANRAPLVIVPTKYYSTPTEAFRRAGISVIIWANHMIRAAAAAMEATAHSIREEESVAGVEDGIATMEHIFALQGADELDDAESRYLRARQKPDAIVLAATRGSALHELTADRPKVMISIAGKPLLHHMLDEFKRQSISRITVVGGYKSEAIRAGGIELRVNAEWENSGELGSLACAADAIGDDIIITYGDLLFRSYILTDLLDQDAELAVVVDSAPQNGRKTGAQDLAWCSRPDDRALFREPVLLRHISESGPEPERGLSSGRWIGMLRGRGDGARWIREALEELRSGGNFSVQTVPDLLNHLIGQNRPVHVNYVHGHWLDVNALGDIDRAGDFAHHSP